MNDPRIRFVVVKLALSTLSTRSTFLSSQRRTRAAPKPTTSKTPRQRPENDPPSLFPEAPKTRIQLDCRHSWGRDVHFLPCLTRKQLRVLLFRLAGQLQPSIRFEVSAQIRRSRRPNSGLCPVLGCRETADPFVRVANDKFEGSGKSTL